MDSNGSKCSRTDFNRSMILYAFINALGHSWGSPKTPETSTQINEFFADVNHAGT